MMGKPISQSYVRDAKKNTKIHLMKLGGDHEGEFQTFDLDHNNQVMHFGNTY